MRRIRRFGLAALLVLGIVTPASAWVVVRRAHPRYYPAHRVIVVGPPVVMVTPYPVYFAGRPYGAIDTDVSPEETRVYVDGRYRGTCDDFDGFPSKLYLPAGRHSIRLVTPDGEEYSEMVRVRAGRELDLNLRLRS